MATTTDPTGTSSSSTTVTAASPIGGPIRRAGAPRTFWRDTATSFRRRFSAMVGLTLVIAANYGQEARTLASLNHPNITLIYDAVPDERQAGFRLVMEYVQGQALADVMANWSGPLPLEIVLDVTIGVLQALLPRKSIQQREINSDELIPRLAVIGLR